MRRQWTRLVAGLLGCAAVLLSSGCDLLGKKQAVPPGISVEKKVVSALDGNGILLAADENNVYSAGGTPVLVFTSAQPISDLGYSSDYTVIAVSPGDDKSFRGFYLRAKQQEHFTPVPTPSMRPKFCYLSGDYLFLAGSDLIQQNGAGQTKVGIMKLSTRTWLKEWTVSGGVDDVKGRGKEVYFAASNSEVTSANVYRTDISTGDTAKLIGDARRYPVDTVAVEKTGEVYFMISQRTQSEFSNKIFVYKPLDASYNLISHFLSNTRTHSNNISAMNHKILITRRDLSEAHKDLHTSLSMLDIKFRKQQHISWNHKPVAVDQTNDRFAVLSEDGTIAFVNTDEHPQITQEITIPDMVHASRLAVKKEGK